MKLNCKKLSLLKNIKKKSLLFFLLNALSLCMITASAQSPPVNNKIPELRNQLDTAKGFSRITILNSLCDQYETTHNDSSLYFAQTALALSEEISNTVGMITSLNNAGYYYHENGQHEKAQACYNRSYMLAQEIDNKTLQSICLRNTGRLHNSLANYPAAIDCYLKSALIASDIKDSSGLAAIYGNLGYLYREILDYDNAEKYHLQSLEIHTALRDTIDMITCYLNLGLVYFNRGDLEHAMRYDQKGLVYARQKNDLEAEAILLGNMSHVISERGDFKEAISYATKSLKIKEEFIKKPKSVAEAYFKFQLIYLRHNYFKESIDWGKKTMKLIARYGDKKLEQNVLKRLAEAYGKAQNHKEAYATLQRYLQLKDSVFDEGKSLQVKQLQTIYNTGKKDMTILQQEGDLKLLAAGNLFKTRLTWVVGGGLFFLFGSIYLYRSRQFAVKAQNLQAHFSRQLLASHEEERKRISRDLHDSVGQSLILIKNKVVLNQDDATVNMVSKALEEVRSISKALHPEVLDKLGLTASIQKIIKEADELTDIFFTEEITTIDGIFSRDHELQIYRIVQEAVNNMIKHSKTESALIRISNEGKKVMLLIQDYGAGFDLTENTTVIHSLGMKTLKERTQILGGKITIQSTKNTGTIILLELDKPHNNV
jgi:signal transduction histidine kinase